MKTGTIGTMINDRRYFMRLTAAAKTSDETDIRFWLTAGVLSAGILGVAGARKKNADDVAKTFIYECPDIKFK